MTGRFLNALFTRAGSVLAPYKESSSTGRCWFVSNGVSIKCVASDSGGADESAGDYYQRAWAQAQHDRLIDPAECTPEEVDFTITWRTVGDEVLNGVVQA